MPESRPRLRVASQPKPPLVSVGLVSWNSAAVLPGCMEALAQQTACPFELIVVDNASTDASLDLISARFPDARFIWNAANEGFSRAHNQAIREAKGAYYLALNPDVVMLPGYIMTLVGVLEDKADCGSAVGKLWQSRSAGEPCRIDSTGLSILRNRRQALRGHGEVDRGQYERIGEVFGVDGAAPLYRRAMLEDIRHKDEFFDEAFFAYKEDVDLAWRARLFGWTAWYNPAAQAIHARSFRPGTRGPGDSSSRRYSVRNRYLLMLKNDTLEGWRRDWLPILLYDLKIVGYLIIRERASLSAFTDLPHLWPQMRMKRRELMRRARVSPGEMLRWFR